jgi:hypothetical protein
LVCEEINKLSALKYDVVRKQYTVFLVPNAGAIETGSYLPTYHTTYRSKSQNIRDEKVHFFEDVKIMVMS